MWEAGYESSVTQLNLSSNGENFGATPRTAQDQRDAHILGLSLPSNAVDEDPWPVVYDPRPTSGTEKPAEARCRSRFSAGRRLRAKGYTVTLEHRHYGFTIKTTAQRLDLLDIRSMQIVPRYEQPSSVPLERREYLMKLQIAVPGALPADLPEVTRPEQILGFDRGSRKTASSSNGMEVRHDHTEEVTERRADWKRVRAKKKDSKRRAHALQNAIRRSRKRRERRKADKRIQIRAILHEAGPLAVAVENIRLPNLLASAAGTEGHPGTNVSTKRSLNRAISEAVMRETGELV